MARELREESRDANLLTVDEVTASWQSVQPVQALVETHGHVERAATRVDGKNLTIIACNTKRTSLDNHADGEGRRGHLTTVDRDFALFLRGVEKGVRGACHDTVGRRLLATLVNCCRKHGNDTHQRCQHYQKNSYIPFHVAKLA